MCKVQSRQYVICYNEKRDADDVRDREALSGSLPNEILTDSATVALDLPPLQPAPTVSRERRGETEHSHINIYAVVSRTQSDDRNLKLNFLDPRGSGLPYFHVYKGLQPYTPEFGN